MGQTDNFVTLYEINFVWEGCFLAQTFDCNSKIATGFNQEASSDFILFKNSNSKSKSKIRQTDVNCFRILTKITYFKDEGVHLLHITFISENKLAIKFTN